MVRTEVFDHSTKMLPLVSVCIPTYNGAEFLQDALESVVAQTYRPLEIIISDDRSQDRTIEIAERFKSLCSIDVSIFKHERYGIAGNWNFSIAKSRGKYIKFIFQDDLLMPECVEQMVRLAETDCEIGLVFSPREVFLAQGAETDTGCVEVYQHAQDVHQYWSNLKPVQWGIELLSDPNFFSSPTNKIGEPSTVLIRKDTFDRVGLFDETLYQTLDMDMWFRIMCQCKIGFVDRRLVKFRVHTQQASRKNVGFKNALDNQMLRAKMLYSSQYELSDREVGVQFKENVQQLLKSGLKDLVAWFELVEGRVQPAELQGELEEVKARLDCTEKALERQLGLQPRISGEVDELDEVQYALIVKNAWYAYKSGEMSRMVELLQKALAYTTLLPTEAVLNWVESFSRFASKESSQLDTYSLVRADEWKKY